MRRRRCTVGASAVVLLLSGCGGEDDPGEVVVSGRTIAVTDNPNSPRIDRVSLEREGEDVAAAEIRPDGTFFIRAERTGAMEVAQATSGYVAFNVRGSYAAGSGYCEKRLPLRVRFENGNWLDAATGKPAFVVFRGVGFCQKVQLPFSLP